MRKLLMSVLVMGALTLLGSCKEKGNAVQEKEFKYLVDEFADLKIIRYQIPGWDDLTLQQKEYVYHLSEAAKWGRDMAWDQNCELNLPLRKLLENILLNYEGKREGEEWENFLVYAKRVFFSRGLHHHYAEDKFFPACSKEYFASLIDAVKGENAGLLLSYIYDKDTYTQRRSTSQSGDIVKLSAVNYYDNVSRDEVESYYRSILDAESQTPISYGLNTKVVKDENGVVKEIPWCVGSIYDKPIRKIIEELEKAKLVAENDNQKRGLELLVEYYKSGDLKVWDSYNVAWVQETGGTVDYINGFIEDYNDPLGRKGAWESYVHIKDHKASERTEIISSNAQWFEDNSPVDPRFKKKECKGISATVVDATILGGDAYPTTAIGINLPNADWIRKSYGSKSVTIANITHAYSFAAQESPKNTLDEFAYSDEEKALYREYGSYADEVHTDLHECLGHGSGQLLAGVSSTAMGEFSSTLEETRADLFGLYYSADPKLVELGIMPDTEAYKALYSKYIRNGIMEQFARVELGRKNTEAHMQNRQLIACWCYEHGKAENIIEKKVRDGKTYFTVNDYQALRQLFGELLAEVQRIKSEGDYNACKALVEEYAVNIDYNLHKEVLERYEKLNLKPYGGFINPEIVPVEKGGKVVDYKIVYPDNFLKQQLEYSSKYSTL